MRFILGLMVALVMCVALPSVGMATNDTKTDKQSQVKESLIVAVDTAIFKNSDSLNLEFNQDLTTFNKEFKQEKNKEKSKGLSGSFVFVNSKRLFIKDRDLPHYKNRYLFSFNPYTLKPLLNKTEQHTARRIQVERGYFTRLNC